MLLELRVRGLGVIDDTTVELGPGMTALTGETGAGKTLVVEALVLLLGGRADAGVVRVGAPEALVEGRFAGGEGEVVLARSVQPGARSRAWVDGRMATAATLAEVGGALVDVYGQREHQSLLDQAAQRRALDSYGGVDLGPLTEARRRRAALRAEMAGLGGNERERARKIDVLRYEISEIDNAGIDGPDEGERLAEEEGRLADAGALREAAGAAASVLGGDGATAEDLLGAALSHIVPWPALAEITRRLRSLQLDLADVTASLREVAEEWEDDPERLAIVQSRRQRLRELCRKYGPQLADVATYGSQARARLADLEGVEVRAAALAVDIEEVDAAVAGAEALVGAARRRAAPTLARAVEARLQGLAMPQARIEIAVGDDPGDDVTFLLAANPGEGMSPLAKAASGGELARAMLALRLEIGEAPPLMVFDEVDSGVGGRAAVAVGQALAELARDRQVVVVTHLPQVAAFAHRHLAVAKRTDGGRTVADVRVLEGEDRVEELARMLSGRPESETARRHAAELLATAGGVRHAG